jgi:hypothetical protein
MILCEHLGNFSFPQQTHFSVIIKFMGFERMRKNSFLFFLCRIWMVCKLIIGLMDVFFMCNKWWYFGILMDLKIKIFVCDVINFLCVEEKNYINNAGLKLSTSINNTFLPHSLFRSSMPVLYMFLPLICHHEFNAVPLIYDPKNYLLLCPVFRRNSI